MKLLNHIFGLVLNLFSLPLSDNTYVENMLGKTMMPLNAIDLLQRAGMGSCRPLLFHFGENALKIGFLPKGFCSSCCPLKMDRDVRFVFYSKQNRSGVPIEPYNEAGAAERAGVDPNVTTVIFIHGFTEPSPGESGKNYYGCREEPYNIVLIDWSDLGAFPWLQNCCGKYQTGCKHLYRNS
ncbi:unnamed protein product [Brassicogethes aeneus]|uniref:Lipase domain-containing protein n=1 Tax=Brassicogethes aeneus TaxID=1431903 RepID=A0A9P0BK37_BRAAE|nr:unnamed protein product [Brassicogethes aeneus]